MTVTSGLSVYQLVLQASLFVKLIMLILLAMFIIAIFVFGKKWTHFARLKHKQRQFERAFWQEEGQDIHNLYEHYAARSPEGVEALFVEGYLEFYKFYRNDVLDIAVILPNCRRAMEATLNRELKKQNRLLDCFASFGSSAPYIGLLGTVSGIMTAFIALGGVSSVSIATVAPSIAEALIATAIGLLVAIPSVLFYNYFASQSQHLLVEYESFIDEFSNLLQSHVVAINHAKTRGGA